MQPGQIVQVNGKPATVVTVGDGVVHLEQDGEAISVHPSEIETGEPGAGEPTNGETKPGDEETESGKGSQDELSGAIDAVMAEVIALKQRVAELERRAAQIEKVLAALTAGPGKGPQEQSPTGSLQGESTAASEGGPAATASADRATEAGGAASSASE